MNQFEAEAQRRMDEERSSWETSKEEELQARLAEEKSTWESQQEDERKRISVDEGVTADEVERPRCTRVWNKSSGEAMDSALLDPNQQINCIQCYFSQKDMISQHARQTFLLSAPFL
mmetsp:Transcript_31384/g.57446  ORF Transcript_31384/g.57446 Transcript_31384/m.57446 type:complete len:117 (+) Transcript_31384:322-672(+)